MYVYQTDGFKFFFNILQLQLRYHINATLLMY